MGTRAQARRQLETIDATYANGQRELMLAEWQKATGEPEVNTKPILNRQAAFFLDPAIDGQLEELARSSDEPRVWQR